jgi:hypothetical protein
MSTNIRFNIHEEEYQEEYDEEYQEEYYDDMEWRFENIEYNTQSNALFAIMQMVMVMEPILSVLDPLEIAIQNSQNDLCLHRNENINLDVSCQPYDTTNKQYDSCSICTDNYDKKENVVMLNCGHIYHPNCIKEWGKYKPNCPICKTDIAFYHYTSGLEETD